MVDWLLGAPTLEQDGPTQSRAESGSGKWLSNYKDISWQEWQSRRTPSDSQEGRQWLKPNLYVPHVVRKNGCGIWWCCWPVTSSAASQHVIISSSHSHVCSTVYFAYGESRDDIRARVRKYENIFIFCSARSYNLSYYSHVHNSGSTVYSSRLARLNIQQWASDTFD